MRLYELMFCVIKELLGHKGTTLLKGHSAKVRIMSPPHTLVGRHIVIGLSVCPSQSLSAQLL